MMSERVQDFVSWVTANMAWFREQTAEEVAEEIGAAILDVDERLGVEVSQPNGDEDREVIVTAFSDLTVFPLVQEIVERIPHIQGWKFIPLKPPRGFDFTLSVGGYELKASKLEFRLIPEIEGGVQLLIPSPLFEMLPVGQEREEMAWLIVEGGIGEELSAKLKLIEFAGMERAKNKHPITELALLLATHRI
jgi:hypothetical protein